MVWKSWCLLLLENQNDYFMIKFTAKFISQSKRFILLVLTLGSLVILSSCGQSEVIPPPVEPVLTNYLNALRGGNIKQAERLYFMPLH